jgi:hypothetical protein
MAGTTDAPGAKREQRFWAAYQAAVLGLFLVLAYLYVWVVQPRYGPDEPRHFNYVKRLVEKRQLPLVVKDESGRDVEADGAHTHHPPLYHLLVSPLFLLARPWGERGQYLAIKAFSPILLLLSLLLFLGTLRRVFPDRPFALATGFAVVALLPEFQLLAGVMNNDALAILMGSLFFWMLIRAWDDPPDARNALLTGLVMALFANSKAQGLTLAPLWAVTLFFRAARSPERRTGFLRDMALGYGVLLLLGTWWYARNHVLYGEWVKMEFWGGLLKPHDPYTGKILSPLEVYATGQVLPLGWRAAEGLFQSFWSQVDWIREDYQPAVYGTLLVLVLAAAWGGIQPPALVSRLREAIKARGARGAATPAPMTWTGSPLLVLGLGFFLNLLTAWYIATFVHLGFYQGGRYLMPSLFGAGALLGAGWERITPGKLRIPAAVALALMLLLLNLVCLIELVTVLNPRYVHP